MEGSKNLYATRKNQGSNKCYCDQFCDNSKTRRKQVIKIRYKIIRKKWERTFAKRFNPAFKNQTIQRKTASWSEAASSVATNSHLAGGVYRARTYDLHDVNVALWPAELRPQARDIVYLWKEKMSTPFSNFSQKSLHPVYECADACNQRVFRV